MNWLARACALLILAMVGIIAWMAATQTFDPAPDVPRGLSSPILGIELVESAGEFHRLMRDPLGWRNRVVFRGQIDEDWYFIPAYTALFIGMGLLAASRRANGRRVLAALVTAIAAGAAYCDYRENLGILAMIDSAPSLVTDAMAAQTRFYSRIKWGLIFASLAPIASGFATGKSAGLVWRILGNAAGLFFLAASIVGLAGVFFHDLAIAWGTSLMVLGFALALPVLARGTPCEAPPVPA